LLFAEGKEEELVGKTAAEAWKNQGRNSQAAERNYKEPVSANGYRLVFSTRR